MKDMMKKHAALLFLLMVVLVFVLPVGAMAEESALPELYLGTESDGKFTGADLVGGNVSAIKQIVITQHAKVNQTNDNNVTMLAEDTNAISGVLDETDTFTNGLKNITSQIAGNYSNHFKVIEVNGAKEEDIEAFIQGISFVEPKNARIKLLSTPITIRSTTQSFTYNTDSGTATGNKKVTDGKIYYNPRNDHFYQYIDLQHKRKSVNHNYYRMKTGLSAYETYTMTVVDWDDVKNDVAGLSLMGRDGYVATVNYPSEMEILNAALAVEEKDDPHNTNYAFLGALRIDKDDDGNDLTEELTITDYGKADYPGNSSSKWTWVNEGEKFYEGTHIVALGGKDGNAKAVSDRYANWTKDSSKVQNEPSNTEPQKYGAEERLQMVAGGGWHDIAGDSASNVYGYFVEYGGEASQHGDTGKKMSDRDNEYPISYKYLPNNLITVPTQYAQGTSVVLPTAETVNAAVSNGAQFKYWYVLNGSEEVQITQTSATWTGEKTDLCQVGAYRELYP